VVRGNWSFTIIAAILGALFEFEFGTAGIFLPAFLISILIFRIFPKRTQILPSLAAFSVWLIPRIIFELRHGFLQSRSFISYVTVGPATESHIPLLERIVMRGNTFLSLTNDTFVRNQTWIAGASVIIGSLILWRLKRNTLNRPLIRFYAFLVMLIFLTLLTASFYQGALWNYYLIGIPALLLPIVGEVFWRLTHWKKAAGFGVLSIWIIYLLWPHLSLKATIWEGDHSVFRNQMAIVKDIFADSHGEKFNVSVYSPSVVDYSYHYLFAWYGDRNIGYIPNRVSSEQLIYLIVEPDKWHPVLREAWLRERDGDGKIVWHKNFPGSIEVEKRIRN
ncbi:MAG: hypothetical protein AAB874_04375, partial [Patescibacteria group bacterium]